MSTPTGDLCDVPECGKESVLDGYCRRHGTYARRHGGNPISNINRLPNGEVRNYLFAQLNNVVTDECMIWPYARAGRYGSVWLGPGLREYVHVVACEHAHGPRPTGMQAAHGPCNKTLCFNPRHLSWKTRLDNERDKLRDGTNTPTGVQNHASKLTPDAVIAIRQKHREGHTQAELSREYGVTPGAIRKIIYWLTWKDVS